MAHTDLAKCNEALDSERRRSQNAVNAMRAQMEHMAQEIEALAQKRAGIGMALEIFLNQTKP